MGYNIIVYVKFSTVLLQQWRWKKNKTKQTSIYAANYMNRRNFTLLVFTTQHNTVCISDITNTHLNGCKFYNSYSVHAVAINTRAQWFLHNGEIYDLPSRK